jgi:hypothetical protein
VAGGAVGKLIDLLPIFFYALANQQWSKYMIPNRSEIGLKYVEFMPIKSLIFLTVMVVVPGSVALAACFDYSGTWAGKCSGGHDKASEEWSLVVEQNSCDSLSVKQTGGITKLIFDHAFGEIKSEATGPLKEECHSVSSLSWSTWSEGKFSNPTYASVAFCKLGGSIGEKMVSALPVQTSLAFTNYGKPSLSMKIVIASDLYECDLTRI